MGNDNAPERERRFEDSCRVVGHRVFEFTDSPKITARLNFILDNTPEGLVPSFRSLAKLCQANGEKGCVSDIEDVLKRCWKKYQYSRKYHYAEKVENELKKVTALAWDARRAVELNRRDYKKAHEAVETLIAIAVCLYDDLTRKLNDVSNRGEFGSGLVVEKETGVEPEAPGNSEGVRPGVLSAQS